MKILLLQDHYDVDHHMLESVFPPFTPVGRAGKEPQFATNEFRKRKGQTLDVDCDKVSEAAEHEDGSTWFILRETGQRFHISDTNFRLVAK